MDTVRDYAISILVVTLISSIAVGILQTPVLKALSRMICGIILCITIVKPLCNMELSFPKNVDTVLKVNASAAVEDGSVASRNALEAYILRETQAYIQNKAAELNADISIEIYLSNEELPVPERAVISGYVTPYQKTQLQKILYSELGIAKEHQEWTG